MNYGAGKYKRTISSYRLFSLTGLCILIPFWIFIMFFPADVLSVMLPSVKLTTIQLTDFRIYMSVLLAFAVYFYGTGMVPFNRKCKTSHADQSIASGCLYIPVLLIVPRFFGVRSIYVACAGSTGWYFYNSFCCIQKFKRLKMNLRAA